MLAHSKTYITGFLIIHGPLCSFLCQNGLARKQLKSTRFVLNGPVWTFLYSAIGDKTAKREPQIPNG